MIDLIIAQLIAVQMLPPYIGAVPSYDAECRVILADHRELDIALMIRGQGKQRNAVATSGGMQSNVPVLVSSAGNMGEYTFVADVFTIPEGSMKLEYAMSYALPSPRPVQDVSVRQITENGSIPFGTGLCWTKEVAQ